MMNTIEVGQGILETKGVCAATLARVVQEYLASKEAKKLHDHWSKSRQESQERKPRFPTLRTALLVGTGKNGFCCESSILWKYGDNLGFRCGQEELRCDLEWSCEVNDEGRFVPEANASSNKPFNGVNRGDKFCFLAVFESENASDTRSCLYTVKKLLHYNVALRVAVFYPDREHSDLATEASKCVQKWGPLQGEFLLCFGPRQEEFDTFADKTKWDFYCYRREFECLE